jgi:hypothetical protein
MEATTTTERKQDSRQNSPRLDDRYGKIGISAVAAAIRHRSAREPRHQDSLRLAYETD